MVKLPPYIEMGVVTLTPERRLLVAILSRVIHDLCSNNSYIRNQAQGWVRKNYKKPPAWSYLWVVEHLDMDPEVLRDAFTVKKIFDRMKH